MLAESRVDFYIRRWRLCESHSNEKRASKYVRMRFGFFLDRWFDTCGSIFSKNFLFRYKILGWFRLLSGILGNMWNLCWKNYVICDFGSYPHATISFQEHNCVRVDAHFPILHFQFIRFRSCLDRILEFSIQPTDSLIF